MRATAIVSARLSSCLFASLFVITALAIGGCRASIPSGRFACGSDADCPPGQSCVAGTCFASDADGGTPDGGGCPTDCDDGLFCNGQETCVDGTCQEATPPCAECDEDTRSCVGDVTVRLVHALPREGVVSFMVGDTTIATASYGEGGTALVPSGAIITVTKSDGSPLATSAAIAQPSVAVLGPSAADTGIAVHVVPDDVGAGSAGEIGIRVLNVAQGGNDLIFLVDPTDTGSARPIATGAYQDFQRSSGSIPLVAAALSAGVPQVVASFSQVVLDASDVIVFMGERESHLGSPFALRPVVVGTGASVLADGQFRVFSALRAPPDTVVYVCQSSVPGATAMPLQNGQLTPTTGVVFGEPFTRGNLGLSTIPGEACTTPQQTVDLGLIQPGLRHLIVLWGPVDATLGVATAQTLVIAEPPYADERGTTLVGVAATHVAPLASGSGPLDFRVAGAPSPLYTIEAASVQNVDVAPSLATASLVVTRSSDSMVLRNFVLPEAAVADQIIVIAADDPMGTLALFWVAGPYGMPWSSGAVEP